MIVPVSNYGTSQGCKLKAHGCGRNTLTYRWGQAHQAVCDTTEFFCAAIVTSMIHFAGQSLGRQQYSGQNSKDQTPNFRFTRDRSSQREGKTKSNHTLLCP